LIRKIALGLIFLIVAEISQAEPKILSVEPNQLLYGQATSVTINVEDWTPESRFFISPSGPYQSNAIVLPTAIHHILTNKNLVYAATAKGDVLILDFTASKVKQIGTVASGAQISAIAVLDNLLIVANTNKALQLFDIRNPKSIIHIDTIIGKGTVIGLSSDTEHVYALQKNAQLTIFGIDKQNGKQTKLIYKRTIELPNTARSFVIRNKLCYFTGPKIGLGIIYLADLNNPRILDRFLGNGDGRKLILKGEVAYVADGAGGVVTFDINNPENIVWLGSNTKSGRIESLSLLNEKLITINAQSRLLSFDIHNPQLPITGSFYSSPNDIYDIAVNGDSVFTATDKGVARIEFSTPASIQISNEGINHGGSRRGFIRNGIAYVADWFSGLHLYDISDPNQPTHLSNVHTPGSSKGVVVEGKYAYVGDDDHGLQIIDISDPKQPQPVSEIITKGLAYTLKKIGPLIYLADHRGGFHIIDVSNVFKPKMIGSFDTQGKSWAIDVQDQTAYVADDSSGLLIFDVSNPSQIQPLGQFNPGGYAEDIVVRGNIAYVVFFDQGLYILDIKNPSAPKLIGHSPIPGNARSISLKDNFAYIASWEAGLQIVDIKNLKRPKVVAYQDTDGSAWGLNIDNGFAYLWDWWGGVKIFDIKQPTHPRFVSRYHASDAIQQIAITDKYLFSANGTRGLQVYDINNPLNPIWTTGVDKKGNAKDIWINEKHAYLALGDAGVAVADISNPFYTHWIGAIPTPGKANKIREHRGNLWVADSRAGLLSIDASNPKQLKPSFAQPLHITDLWPLDEKLLLTNVSGGLSIFGISDKDRLQHLKTVNPEIRYSLVRAQQKRIALVAPGMGIAVLKYNENQITPIAAIRISEAIKDIQLDQDIIYVLAEHSGLMRFDLANPAKPILTSVIAKTAQLASFAVNQSAAFFSGETSINSVSLLSNMVIHRRSKSKISLRVPADMPLGRYHFGLYDGQKTRILKPNALSVSRKKTKSRPFNLDDLKKILKKRQLNSPPIQSN
jgi:hypothetical protein